MTASVLALGLATAIWYMRRPLPPPHITKYTKITHDGRPTAAAVAVRVQGERVELGDRLAGADGEEVPPAREPEEQGQRLDRLAVAIERPPFPTFGSIGWVIEVNVFWAFIGADAPPLVRLKRFRQWKHQRDCVGVANRRVRQQYSDRFARL
jgi:hypothetical protein